MTKRLGNELPLRRQNYDLVARFPYPVEGIKIRVRLRGHNERHRCCGIHDQHTVASRELQAAIGSE